MSGENQPRDSSNDTSSVIMTGQVPKEVPNKPDSQTFEKSNENKLFRRLVLTFVTVQVLWALVIPIKNVVIIPFPTFREDSLFTKTQSYDGFNESSKLVYSGTDVMQLMEEVLAISLDNDQVRSIFEQSKDFAIDQLGQVLSPKDHSTITKYYTLVFQSSEFPGGVYTPRTDTIVRVLSDGSKERYTIGCKAGHNVMHGTVCVDNKGLPCDDSAWATTPPSVTLTDVNFNPLLNGTGWQNNIGLLGLVEYFHYYMRLVFAKQNWDAVVSAGNLDIGFQHLSKDDDNFLIETPLIFNFATQSNRSVAQNGGIIWNCMASELLLGEVYLANYTLGMIQSSLMSRNLYNASKLVDKSSVLTKRALVVLDGYIHITSGAGFGGYRDTIKSLGNTIMTHTSISKSNLKHDRPMTGPLLFGSSMRNMIYMGYYPNSYYSVLKMYPNASDYIYESSALGGMFGGFNGFKFDFVHNTMTNFKLAERSLDAGTGYSSNWYDDEEIIATWYATYEANRSSNNLIDMAVARLGNIPPPVGSIGNSFETNCYQALFKRIAQVSWLVMLQMHPVTEHLAFMSVKADMTPQLYFLKQMMKTEVLGENTYGYREHVPFNPSNISSSKGTAWPLIPILTSLMLRHGTTSVLNQLTTVLNSTFMSLVDFKSGSFMFHDTDFCPIGRTTLGVTVSDTPATAYNKIFNSLSLLLSDTLATADTIRTRMESELQQSIHIRSEYLNDTRINSIFKYQGPPVYWSHSPLAVGLMRLSTRISPDNLIVGKIKSSLICYNVLETRYLNISTRCWSEFQNVNETRAQYNSEGLRTLLLSAWSMGIVLNLFAAVVAFRFALRVWHVARVTGLHDKWSTLLCIDIEEFGLSTFSECALMACSAAPFMFSYQLPQDPEYIANSRTSHLGSVYLDEVLITMGITWFIRLGMDCGASIMHLRCKNRWFTQQSNIIRASIIVGVYIVRILTISPDRTYNSAIWGLALSCILSALAGMVGMLLSYAFDKPLTSAQIDPISNTLQAASVPRNIHCIFSQQGLNWSHMGLVLEGWTCSPEGETLVFKNATGDLLLIVRDTSFDVQKLNAMNRDQYLALERTPSSIKASLRARKGTTKYLMDPGQAAPDPAQLKKRSKLSLKLLLVSCIVCIQALWALSVPVRNVLLFPYPTFNYDNSTTASASFDGFDTSMKVQFTGAKVLSILQKALHVSLNNPDVRKVFETSGAFAIDNLGQILSPSDHETFSQLYALVFQSSEFPAGSFTPRQEKIVRTMPDGSKEVYTVGCRAEQATLNGATCVDANGTPCVSVDSTSKLTDLNTTTTTWVWSSRNRIGLLLLKVEIADLAPVVSSEGYLIETPAIFSLAANGSAQVAQNSNTIWNCLATEVLLTELYVANFTLRMIQEELIASKLYKAQEILPKDAIIETRVLTALDATIQITTAAGYYSYVESARSLFGKTVTTTAISNTVLKQDLKLADVGKMGSSVRNLLVLASDTMKQFSVQRVTQTATDYLFETRILGGMFSGYLGFKDDALHNTMGVYKLAERPSAHRPDRHELDYFNLEAANAAWYVSYENQKNTGNLLSKVVQRFGMIRVEFFKNVMVNVTTDVYETMCYQALMRRVSQIVWLTALRLHPVLQHLVFMSAQNDVTDYQWFHQQMMVNEIVGENAFGGRVHLPYNALFISSNLGSGWPMIPLLHALNQIHNATFLHSQIMHEMDTSFTSLIELENGLVNFRDATHCPIGMNTFGVTKDETLSTLYTKISPGFNLLIHDTIAQVGSVHAEMELALGREIRVPLEYLQDSRSSSVFSAVGPPPIQWTHSPIGIGLMRLSTKENPFQDNIRVLRDSMVCYDTLETRTLTQSFRCWSEPLSSGETRSSYGSVQLRLVIFSAWAIGVILNAIGEFIAVKFVLKLWKVWRLTGLDLYNWEYGLLQSTHIQSLGGVVSVLESAMLAASSIALLFGYRLPQDPGFIPSTKSLRLRGFDEFIMTLGMTWTIHLGMEFASSLLTLKHKSSWFLGQNVLAKMFLTALVYVLLIVTRNETDYDKAIGSLIGIWCFALLSGMTSMGISKILDRPPRQPAVYKELVKPIGEDEISKSFTDANLPRNRIGFLSQQHGRWSLLGIVLEGWRGVATGENSFLMACDNILLHLSAGGAVKPLTCKDITPSDFAKLVKATNHMKSKLTVTPIDRAPSKVVEVSTEARTEEPIPKN